MGKSIKYYKDASNLNNYYAKNNLGIIYKNGIANEVTKNMAAAREYFQDAIRIKNDPFVIINLVKIFLFEESSENNIDQAIKLLFKSLNLCFFKLNELLLLALVKKIRMKYGNFVPDFYIFNEELKTVLDIPNDLSYNIFNIIKSMKLNDIIAFNQSWIFYQNYEILFDDKYEPIEKQLFESQKHIQISQEKQKLNNITKSFYDGFKL